VKLHKTSPSSKFGPLRLDQTVPPLNEVRGTRRIRFARDESDVEACLRLRYEVFNVELGEGLKESEALGLDRDRFDDVCDHLMVFDEPSGEVVGTYRMQTHDMARAAHGFYSAGEYDLGHVPAKLLTRTVELGRAAILGPHRDKTVLFLLWRGLASYQQWNGMRYLFGCSSITSQDPREGLVAYDWLERAGHLHPGFHVPALPEYACESPDYKPSIDDYVLPKLFEFYIRYGAKICSSPAIDREFGTIDFLTWTDTGTIRGKFVDLCTQGLPQRG
jgi:putative hemolysin